MVKRIGSARRKTRTKLKKTIRKRGKVSITRFLQKFVTDDRVLLNAEPAIQKGMYHPRFHGKVGTIQTTKGKCYIVDIKDKGKKKELIVHPVHLKRM